MKKCNLKRLAMATLLLSATMTVAAEQPNYVKALGLKGDVVAIGAYNNGDDSDMNYCTYEFNSKGQLISYDEAETVEGSYNCTAYFGADGLPSGVKSVFINYWTEPDAKGDYPVTTTTYSITRIHNGNTVVITLDNGDEFKKDIEVTLDKEGRIIEVINPESNEAKKYFYKGKDTLPRYADGRIAFPQVDMMDGSQLMFPAKFNPNAEKIQNGTWEFEIKRK